MIRSGADWMHPSQDFRVTAGRRSRLEPPAMVTDLGLPTVARDSECLGLTRFTDSAFTDSDCFRLTRLLTTLLMIYTLTLSVVSAVRRLSSFLGPDRSHSHSLAFVSITLSVI